VIQYFCVEGGVKKKKELGKVDEEESRTTAPGTEGKGTGHSSTLELSGGKRKKSQGGEIGTRTGGKRISRL